MNQLPSLSGRTVPGIPRGFTVVSQPLDRILPPWLANPRNPAMSPHSMHPSHWWISGRKKNEGWEGGGRRSSNCSTDHCTKIQQSTKLPCIMWACTYGIDRWMPATLVDRLTTKLVDRLTTKLVNCWTAMLVNGLTAKLMSRLTTKPMNCLTAKLVVVNLVKLHLIKFAAFLNYLLTVTDSVSISSFYL